MRFPIRDVIPSRSVPIVCWIAALLPAAWLLAHHPGTSTLLYTVIHTLPLLVLGEAVEDQFGHDRVAGLLAVAAGVGAWAGDLLPALTASIIGAHLALFPAARIVVALRLHLLEVPSYFLAGCWFFLLVMQRAPLPVTVGVLALAAATARLLRRQDRARWDHFDRSI